MIFDVDSVLQPASKILLLRMPSAASKTLLLRMLSAASKTLLPEMLWKLEPVLKSLDQTV